jgi:hypothetical protein
LTGLSRSATTCSREEILLLELAQRRSNVAAYCALAFAATLPVDPSPADGEEEEERD